MAGTDAVERKLWQAVSSSTCMAQLAAGLQALAEVEARECAGPCPRARDHCACACGDRDCGLLATALRRCVGIVAAL